MDLSPAMLREARRLARGRKNPRFLRGDMRRLDSRGEFDAAYNMFTSFGYFSHSENVRALRRIVRAVRPGGRVLLDVRNLDYDKEHVANRNWWKRGKRIVLEEHRLDPRTGVVENRWWILRPERGTHVGKRMRLVVYNPSAWRGMLRHVGAPLEALYSGYDARRYTRPDRSRLIVVGRREA
ncbi:MAG: class I SAM-dependent methyltransferase [Planctomycetales bacterium]|nr:class I SAM-dependent methyltransferase [Planctomycetales bacterium]